jgi:hypothetical protein
MNSLIFHTKQHILLAVFRSIYSIFSQNGEGHDSQSTRNQICLNQVSSMWTTSDFGIKIESVENKTVLDLFTQMCGQMESIKNKRKRNTILPQKPEHRKEFTKEL